MQLSEPVHTLEDTLHGQALSCSRSFPQHQNSYNASLTERIMCWCCRVSRICCLQVATGVLQHVDKGWQQSHLDSLITNLGAAAAGASHGQLLEAWGSWTGSSHRSRCSSGAALPASSELQQAVSAINQHAQEVQDSIMDLIRQWRALARSGKAHANEQWLTGSRPSRSRR